MFLFIFFVRFFVRELGTFLTTGKRVCGSGFTDICTGLMLLIVQEIRRNDLVSIKLSIYFVVPVCNAYHPSKDVVHGNDQGVGYQSFYQGMFASNFLNHLTQVNRALICKLNAMPFLTVYNVGPTTHFVKILPMV